MTIYDLQGRKVDILFDGRSLGGRQELTWEAKGRASGIYFVRVVSRDERVTAKMVLLK